MQPRQRARFVPRGSAGFTLMELLVALAVMAVIIVAALTLLDSTTQMANRQISQVELQQALRVAQNDMARRLRGIGRGGLPHSSPNRTLPDNGLGLTVLNNVGAATEIVTGSNVFVEEGTDVLVVRGVFTSPVYQIKSVEEDSLTLDLGAGTGVVIVPAVTPAGTFNQPLDTLREAIDDGLPEAILMVSASTPDVFGIAELDPTNSFFTAAAASEPAFLTIAFRFDNGTYTDEYSVLSSGDPAPATTDPTFPAADLSTARVSHLGVLEEYRYYLRTEAGGAPKLSRARVYPGTAAAWAGDADNLTVDQVDNVLDLQVAMAFDSTNAGGADGDIFETLDGSSDDWLLNDASDLASDGTPVSPFDTLLASKDPKLFYLRVTTMARSQVPDRNHLAREIDHIEDRDYTADPLNDDDHRRYVRAFLHTIVDMRNQ